MDSRQEHAVDLNSGKAPRMIVAWDFDGPLNDLKYISDTQGAMAVLEGGVIVTNPELILTTLKVLEKNKVLSVLASQRITYDHDLETRDGKLRKAVFDGLDKAFGADRAFLTKANAEIMGNHLQPRANETGKDKSIILDGSRAIPDCKQVPNQHVILIDDQVKYKSHVNPKGYGFIHAPRGNDKQSYEDRKYLAEVLVRTVPSENIIRDINLLAPSPEIASELCQTVQQFLRESKLLTDTEKFIDELRLYKTTRENEYNEQKKSFHSFWGRLTGMSKTIKIEAVDDMITALREPNFKFSEQTLEALRDSRLGDIVKKYELLGAVPQGFIDANNSRLVRTCAAIRQTK